MMELLAQGKRVGGPIWGIVVPGIIFGISFVLTWMLYKHFSRRPPN